MVGGEPAGKIHVDSREGARHHNGISLSKMLPRPVADELGPPRELSTKMAFVMMFRAADPSGMTPIVRFTVALLLVVTCAGCSGPNYAGGFSGRRGYDGNGDYGYDLAASRAEAQGYRVRAARSYPAPGTPEDPWAPYIQRAAARYAVPERWIREVMRQESGGRQQAANGTLTISSAGAMGLMQVMPSTYDILRQRYGLGDDPYEPQDNILAGTAYIREMYDRYGSPGFLAAYNAGPLRLDAYLAGTSELPDETVHYVANVAPRLGSELATSGPYRVGADGPSGSSPDVDPADRAFDGGGLVTADLPTGWSEANVSQDTGPSGLTLAAAAAAPAQTVFAPAVQMATLKPRALPGALPSGWAVQVGAFPNPAVSQAAITTALRHARQQLAAGQPMITTIQHPATLYRARLIGLSSDNAVTACSVLQKDGLGCFVVPPGS
jgi:hypothetical protein